MARHASGMQTKSSASLSKAQPPKMNKRLALLALTLALVAAGPLVDGFRPPAVPLIVFDPYMNIWSTSDKLYDSWPNIWYGQTKGMSGAIRVDGRTYRFMGSSPDFPNTAEQTSVKVQPTTTIYTFNAGPVELTLKFISPTIPTDLELLAQPITYITFRVKSTDGHSHQVEIYYDQSGEFVTHKPDVDITWDRGNVGSLIYARMGTQAQTLFKPVGDAVGINWGHAYVAVPSSDARVSVNSDATSRQSFAQSGTIPKEDDGRKPRRANDQWPVIAARWSFNVGAADSTTKYLIFAYDDVFSLSWFSTPFPAYWKKSFNSTDALLNNAQKQMNNYISQTERLDKVVMSQTLSAGGSQYSTIASLAWRQTFGATKLVWNTQKEELWYFLKEISSNGDFNTVDVLFPAIPLLLWANPNLAELILLPHLSYAANEAPIRYGLEWAPHQLGVYPVADVTPQAQEQMPVEESGDLLLIIEWLAKTNATEYTSRIYPRYKDTIDQWANYLISGYNSPQNQGPSEEGSDLPGDAGQASSTEDCRNQCLNNPNCAAWGFDTCGSGKCWFKGTNTATTPNNCRTSGYFEGKLVLPDPGYQLCTDDFLGPIPHNVNLASKGIIAVDAYADFLIAMNRKDEAQNFKTVAKSFADHWVSQGFEKDHYKLQYDLPDSYSLQYNLVFQKFLKIETFDKTILENEAKYYFNHHWNRYGAPLSSQTEAQPEHFTKLDWLAWSGTLTSDATLAAHYWEAIYLFAHETPSRVPLSDWYRTHDARQQGFQARPVVGGFYAWMLVQEGANAKLQFP
ncbi:hypothetical protein PROFUN_05735 [Planoprotostelium fungivorum]|uniref:Apple domain-containing protein n=1 Tax=Planoprotostelium fungivorum TaxID=1890364 RepID=A0A2P6NQI5_9EUKA|nr:hypothetical protein PROFUN_05735 [Planoprotostelium fungivorum]